MMLYYILSGILVLGILYGIKLMSSVKTAKLGNNINAICTALAISITLYKYELIADIGLYVFMGIGLVLGLIMAKAVKMIEMPQAVAVLNGFGGLASALISIITINEANNKNDFAMYTAALALIIGLITFSGSMVAAGKLHKILPQKSTVFKSHNLIANLLIIISIISVCIIKKSVWEAVIFSTLFGIVFSIRVGGADMPITISLLNSLSGVAGGIAGVAIYDPLLTAVGGIVGASGLILTQIMCKAMNRKLSDILLGKTTVRSNESVAEEIEAEEIKEEISLSDILRDAKKVIIIPGYGMALSQAQTHVKILNDMLEKTGVQVKFAIHPVAGRMPGHMNVLLCEVDLPYDKLYEMNDINEEFKDADLAIVIGANDVVNPAANTAEGTPIYGMPVLKVEEARRIIVCNYDMSPGYAGVKNPLYSNSKTIMMTGDAKDSIQKLINILSMEIGSAENLV